MVDNLEEFLIEESKICGMDERVNGFDGEGSVVVREFRGKVGILGVILGCMEDFKTMEVFGLTDFNAEDFFEGELSIDEGVFWGIILDDFEVLVIVVDFAIMGRVMREEERVGGMIGFNFLIIGLEL